MSKVKTVKFTESISVKNQWVQVERWHATCGEASGEASTEELALKALELAISAQLPRCNHE